MEILHNLGKDFERYVMAMYSEKINNSKLQILESVKQKVNNGAEIFSIENSIDSVKIGYTIVENGTTTTIFKRK